METKERKIEKYNINEEVYIVYCDEIIKCKVTEITKNASGVTYRLLGEDKIEYLRVESTVYKNTEEANNFIRKCEYNRKINTMNIEICDYQKWVSSLDMAIQKYENCKTDIKITLISNETNSSDKKLFGVTNTGSKQLLEYIRKYYKEQLDIRVKELDKFKEESNGK